MTCDEFKFAFTQLLNEQTSSAKDTLELKDTTDTYNFALFFIEVYLKCSNLNPWISKFQQSQMVLRIQPLGKTRTPRWMIFV